MGRKSKAQIAKEQSFNELEAQYELAISCLNKYGNTSLGIKIINSVTPEVAASILTNRTGHNITVRTAVTEEKSYLDKKYPAITLYIAEDNGPLAYTANGQLSLF